LQYLAIERAAKRLDAERLAVLDYGRPTEEPWVSRDPA
jgi:hypothetical protein